MQKTKRGVYNTAIIISLIFEELVISNGAESNIRLLQIECSDLISISGNPNFIEEEMNSLQNILGNFGYTLFDLCDTLCVAYTQELLESATSISQKLINIMKPGFMHNYIDESDETLEEDDEEVDKDEDD